MVASRPRCGLATTTPIEHPDAARLRTRDDRPFRAQTAGAPGAASSQVPVTEARSALLGAREALVAPRASAARTDHGGLQSPLNSERTRSVLDEPLTSPKTLTPRTANVHPASGFGGSSTSRSP